MRILLVNYRYFISGGPEKYMFNIKKMLEDNGHEVIPFSIHSNKNVETEYSKYFVEPIGSRDATYFEECKKTPKVIWQMLTRSIWYDNLPNTALESFQYSKPVIASNIGSLPELVLDGVNGYLFKPADVRELCEKVALLDDDAVVEKMGAASRARLEDRFAPQTHYNTLMKVFSRVRKEN